MPLLSGITGSMVPETWAVGYRSVPHLLVVSYKFPHKLGGFSTIRGSVTVLGGYMSFCMFLEGASQTLDWWGFPGGLYEVS